MARDSLQRREQIVLKILLVVSITLLAAMCWGVRCLVQQGEDAAAKKADLVLRVERIEAIQASQAKDIEQNRARLGAMTIWMVEAMQVIEPERKQFWIQREKELTNGNSPDPR